MQMTMTGLKNRMMAAFLPAATQLTDGLWKLFAGDMSGVDDIADGIMGIAEKIGEMAPVIWEAAKTLGSKLLEGILSNAGEMGTKAGDIIGPLIEGIAAKIPDIVIAGFNLIFNFAKGLIKALPQIWIAIGKMGLEIIKGLGSNLWGKVTEAANGIKDKFLAPINKLRDKVKAIIDKIKGFFSFTANTPKLKLPHFSISPEGWKLKDLMKGSIPKLSIKWYAEGGIADNPTVFGGFGEAGPEAILPLDPFWERLDRWGQSLTAARNNGPVTVILQVDGKEVARTTAPYM
jgi:phage-related protein